MCVSYPFPPIISRAMNKPPETPSTKPINILTNPLENAEVGEYNIIQGSRTANESIFIINWK